MGDEKVELVKVLEDRLGGVGKLCSKDDNFVELGYVREKVVDSRTFCGAPAILSLAMCR